VERARLIASFLSDPMARLPSFARYGSLEYPFPVAVKTGTSQGYRDAWTVAWSEKYIVATWLGRADDGTMTRVSGVRSAAQLARSIMMQAHGARPGDSDDPSFPPPPGRAAVELCIFSGQRSAGSCHQTLREWADPQDMPPFEDTAVLQSGADSDRLVLAIPAQHRAWARDE